MNPLAVLSMMPTWRWLAPVAAFALAFASGWFAHAYTTDRAEAIDRAERAELAAEAERQARMARDVAARKSQEVQDARERTMRSHAAAAADARSELDRLRDAIAAAEPAASSAGTAGIADGIPAHTAGRIVVSECGGALTEMARHLDQRDADLTALQGWVRAECRPATTE